MLRPHTLFLPSSNSTHHHLPPNKPSHHMTNSTRKYQSLCQFKPKTILHLPHTNLHGSRPNTLSTHHPCYTRFRQHGGQYPPSRILKLCSIPHTHSLIRFTYPLPPHHQHQPLVLPTKPPFHSPTPYQPQLPQHLL